VCFDLDITLRRGDRLIAAQCTGAKGVTALFGRSGVGKTSVLNMVAGLTRPDAGRIVVDGRVLFDADQGIDIPTQNRGAGYVFQGIRLFPHMNVEANLLYGWRLAPPENRWITLPEVCAFLGIEPLLRRRPTSLSGGEAQRVAIGRALLSGAKFLLMDEPLSSLDAPRREEILGVIEQIVAQLRLPILYVSHDAKEVARLATHIVELA
jgi:molybdate transport system ATP-binding protein